MTPEREAEIRRCVREIEEDVAEADLDEADRIIVEMLTEIDRLRALPAIATCGDCAHRYAGGCERAGDRPVPSDEPPPEWCPLRGGR